MAFSYAQYVGDGSTTNFAIPCPYLQQSDIGVKVNGVTASFTFFNSTTVQVTPAPALAAVVEVRRTTNKAALFTVFQDGSVLGKVDLNNSATQLLYIAQEAFDASQSIIINALGLLDGGGKRLTNIADPLSAQDVATKNYIDAKLVAAGNVPPPGLNVGKWLKATGAAAWSWTSIVTADITDWLFPATSTASAGGDFVRVKTDKSAYEFRTPAQVLSDIGANSAANLSTGTLPDARLSSVVNLSRAKAWVKFTVSGTTPTINASYNVSSVTRNASGDYTVTFQNPMADGNYVPVITCDSGASDTTIYVGCAKGNISQVASQFRMTIFIPTVGASDPQRVHVAIFGN